MDSKDLLLLDKIIAAGKNDLWGNAERADLKKLRVKLGSPTEVAQALGISAQSLFRWEKEEEGGREFRPPPPERQLRKLKDLIASGHFDEKPKGELVEEGRANIFEVMMRTRTTQEVLEQSAFCERAWIMRTGRPFVIASDPRMVDFLIKFIRGQSAATIFFVYRDAKEGQELESFFRQAKASYEGFRAQIDARDDCKFFLDRIKAVPFCDETDAQMLGLTDFWTSFCMCEYSPEGFDKYGRSVNVWQEFLFDTAPSPYVEQKKPVWLELPAQEAMIWRDNRWPVLKKLLKAIDVSI